MLEKEIFAINSAEDFERLAIEAFRFQYENVLVYRDFCNLLNVAPIRVNKISQIPFLPIQFFKSHKIMAKGFSEEIIFTSSGTTGSITSKHYIADIKIYQKSFQNTFKNQYGHPSDFAILALLPSYLEREGSSLIYMVENLIEKSQNVNSGFYLYDTEALIEKLIALEEKGEKVLQ